jgi:hypothetical protein
MQKKNWKYSSSPDELPRRDIKRYFFYYFDLLSLRK